MKLNIGCGKHHLEDYINIDCVAPADMIHDVEESELPYEDNTVDEIVLSHVLEHFKNPLEVMQELWRVAKPDAKIHIRLPYGSSDAAWTDPTHIRPYFVESFFYFTQPYYQNFDYGYTADLSIQEIGLILQDHVVETNTEKLRVLLVRERNVVKEMVVKMIAVKPARERRLELCDTIEIGFAR